MKQEWKRFYLPMAAVSLILIAVSIWSKCRYGTVFWNAFYPQFLATAIGVVFSIMFAWALWRLQQRAQESRKRQQLISDLKFEVEENMKRLEDTEEQLGQTKRQDREYGFTRGLRTIASKHLLNPENLVIVKDIQLEDDVDWMLSQVELYNVILNDAFREFLSDLDSGKDYEEVRSQLCSSIFSGSPFRFLKGFLAELSRKLADFG